MPNCRIARRVVWSFFPQNPLSQGSVSPTLATKAFRRVASKGTNPGAPAPVRRGCGLGGPELSRLGCSVGVRLSIGRGGERRIVWRSSLLLTSCLPSTLPMNVDGSGGRR